MAVCVQKMNRSDVFLIISASFYSLSVNADVTARFKVMLFLWTGVGTFSGQLFRAFALSGRTMEARSEVSARLFLEACFLLSLKKYKSHISRFLLHWRRTLLLSVSHQYCVVPSSAVDCQVFHQKILPPWKECYYEIKILNSPFFHAEAVPSPGYSMPVIVYFAFRAAL